jgi:hypothetical protein
MARMLPHLSEQKLSKIGERSIAEATFYRYCQKKLNDNYLVFFSVPWIDMDNRGNVRDGEVDFMIFDPNSGFLTIEIKGGGISYEPSTGEWFTKNNKGVFEIKDPFEQAKKNKYRVLELLKTHCHWARTGVHKILAGHAVFFPDIQTPEQLVTPQSPLIIVGGKNDLDNLDKWVARVFAYWKGQDNKFQPLGTSGLSIAECIFSRPLEVLPSLASQLEDEERVRIKLTDQQAYLLSALGMRKRAAISGGAGTGKTLIALHKAQKLAESGIKTLLLCYNHPLSDYLKAACEGFSDNLLPMSFHQLCEWRSKIVKLKTGRDLIQEAKEAYPGEDLFDIHMPYALALSTEELPERFEAIVIDEGQDFKEEYWLPIEMLLASPRDSYLFIFFDQNQALYKCAATFPITELPFILSTNCRNTKYIHEAAYHFYSGATTNPPSIVGEPIEIITAPSVAAQAKKLHAAIIGLIQEGKVSPVDITVIVIGTPKSAYYDLLKSYPLPSKITWSFEKHRVDNTILVDTVKRFKGLESAVLFLWGFDDIELSKHQETIYVGISRAKSRLFVIGKNTKYDQLLGYARGAEKGGQVHYLNET